MSRISRMCQHRHGAFVARGMALALAVAVAGGCSDDPVAPDVDDEFDAAALAADLNAVSEVLQTPAWQSFEALGPRFSLASASPSVAPLQEAPGRIEPGQLGSAALGSDVPVAAARRLAAAASATPVISSEARGTTFVIDPSTGEYTPDPSRTGAPSNGVRFILYAINPVTGEPLLEQEIGHADLVDEGDATDGIALRLTVVSGGETYVDYSVQVEGDDTSGTIAVAGYVRDAENRLDFELDIAGTSGPEETFDLDVEVAIVARDFEVEVSVSGMAADGGGSGEIQVFVRCGEETIEVNVAGSDEAISAEFRLNGELFATASGDPRDPVIVGAGGEPLTMEERQVLGHILEVMEELFEFFGELLAPAAAIVLLGIAL